MFTLRGSTNKIKFILYTVLQANNPLLISPLIIKALVAHPLNEVFKVL